MEGLESDACACEGWGGGGAEEEEEPFGSELQSFAAALRCFLDVRWAS